MGSNPLLFSTDHKSSARAEWVAAGGGRAFSEGAFFFENRAGFVTHPPLLIVNAKMLPGSGRTLVFAEGHSSCWARIHQAQSTGVCESRRKPGIYHVRPRAVIFSEFISLSKASPGHLHKPGINRK